jgi:CxxC motif-containing protein
MKSLTCIVCPIGCALEVNEDASLPEGCMPSASCMPKASLSVTGNKCARGIAYALEEIRAPKRVVTATVLIKKSVSAMTSSINRIPVKTSSPCPREKIPELLKDIYKIEITPPVKVGDVLISDWQGEKINIVATRTIN